MLQESSSSSLTTSNEICDEIILWSNHQIWIHGTNTNNTIRPLFPHHIFTSTKKKLFGALSPIGPIPRYLSCLSSFSSQPSPFPLPFHSHWFSSLKCQSRAVTLIHSPFDDPRNSYWCVFIYDEILMVSRATTIEHPNPPSIASFWDSSEIRARSQRGWTCIVIFSYAFP